MAFTTDINVEVKQAQQACLSRECQILDVRTSAEWADGVAVGAFCLSLMDINALAADQLSKQRCYYVMCQTGQRSLQAIKQLQKLGFSHLFHVYQGYQEWHKQQLPTEKPQLNENDLRYQRHHQLQGFGRSGQQQLLNAHVLIIGAGGLGSASALYLAAAGVGQLTIIDDDVVQLSNLQRQIIHSTASIDTLKVDSAKTRLLALNPTIKINTIVARIDQTNVARLVNAVDIVIDGSDNLDTRYLVNDNCKKHHTPLVYAAVYQYEAQLTTFDFRRDQAPCLRCLFPQTQGFEPENCSTVGVLGVVPGLAGIIQATEAIKIITGIGETLAGQLQLVDLLDNKFKTIKYNTDENCPLHDG